MNHVTLPVFNAKEFILARRLLATQVTEMMGRKLEEGDWAKVYCTAKGIPLSGWSNTDIDIMFGHVGVEQKAMARRANQPIKDACGTILMHPAGTRAIRIPTEQDPTKAARDILTQYGVLIARRRLLVAVNHSYHNNQINRAQAVAQLQADGGYSRPAAEARVPLTQTPSLDGVKDVDLRTGWLLWQDTLKEFLYFEEPMIAPDPKKYVAEWRDRAGGGSRIASRNLWIYEQDSGDKHYSVTTEAGAKIQPYFKVPNPNDPNLYHFVVQGEDCGNGLIRVWLSQVTADLLQQAVGDLTPPNIAAAVEKVKFDQIQREIQGQAFGPLAVEVLIPVLVYERIKTEFIGVSDEHYFKQLLEALKT